MTASLLGVAGIALPTAAATTVSRKARNSKENPRSNTSVAINANEKLATVPATLVGANVAVYDSLLSDATTGTRVREAGIEYLRYPGGSHSDVYHWKTHTAENGAYLAPNTSFDEFMTMAQAAGARPVITVNYGSGTAQEAADWVRYANITKGYGITHWEIGNEVFGNGHYGTGWEYDTHADKSPHAYANAAMEYITAMKAVDPSIKVGVVLTTPGFWPDGEVGSEDSGDWNDVVLSTVGGRADFGIFHWYPYTDSTTEAEMLTRPPTAASVVEAFRADLDRHDATNTEIFVTELNGGKPRNTQAQALWAADAYLSLAAAGVHNATWWNVHNGSGGTATDVTGATDYNDEGLLSNGSGNEPAAQTPFRAYYGIQMLSRVAQAGDILVRASSSTTTVSAHAARRANGALSVLLVNKDPANSVTVTLSYTGYRPKATVTTDTYGLTDTQITSAANGTATSQTVPPYGLVAVHVTAS
ncbi:cellulose-binding protein [Streptomyces sp. NPDC021354]|uniref:cellulose-binding protein n=1 Tax=Streptomyces sp. NPDC021354 TaxID=3154793 RepID=UPI0033D54712